MPRLANIRINLKIPGFGGISGTWEPDEAEIRAAWELYVEMATRSPLGGFSPQEGSAREALNSIYSLFDTTRAILRSYGPAVACPKGGLKLSFGYLAISMLNHVLRPLLTEWHPRLQQWERENPTLTEMDWPGRSDLLEALGSTESLLRQYAKLFTEVAEVPELTEELDGQSPAS